MPHDRFFTESDLQRESEVEITGEEAFHLSKVMRKQAGETVELVNGRGLLARCELIEGTKRSVRLKIRESEKMPPPRTELILLQALPRASRLDTIVEKCTELGVTEFHFFPGDRSEKNTLSTNQLERLRHLTISALKQSGRYYLPKVQVIDSISRWEKFNGVLIIGSLEPSAESLIDTLVKHPSKRYAVVIGPEAGLTNKEEQLLIELGAIGVRLNEAILRTDTAPIVACGVMALALSQ